VSIVVGALVAVLPENEIACAVPPKPSTAISRLKANVIVRVFLFIRCLSPSDKISSAGLVSDISKWLDGLILFAHQLALSCGDRLMENDRYLFFRTTVVTMSEIGT
jgi:hypothetical protein